MDARILKRIGNGDQRALGLLYDSHAALLSLRLRGQGASIEEAEDVIQETFLEVWQNSASFRGDGAVGAWLWGIASRRYLMLIRGEVRHRRRQSASSAQREVEDTGDTAWVLAVDASDALSRLSPDLREAFRAVAVEGLSVAEAAVLLGAPEGTVKSRVHRARQAMRKELK